MGHPVEKKILLFSTKEESIREESVLQSPNLDLENEPFNEQTNEKPVEEEEEELRKFEEKF